MTTHTVTPTFYAAQLEWWNGQTALELLQSASDVFGREAVRVYSWGGQYDRNFRSFLNQPITNEAELWIGFTCEAWDVRVAKSLLTEGTGVRCKTIAQVPESIARGDLDGLMSHFYDNDED